LTKKFYDYEDNEDNHSLTTNKENDNEDGSGNNLLLIGVIINFFVMLILYFKWNGDSLQSIEYCKIVYNWVDLTSIAYKNKNNINKATWLNSR